MQSAPRELHSGGKSKRRLPQQQTRQQQKKALILTVSRSTTDLTCPPV